MSELAVDLYVPQMAHLATDQGGTLRKAWGKDINDMAEDCLDYSQASVPILV